MGILIVLLYMVSLYIRPQDWVPFFLDWPTNDILIPIGLVTGYMAYARDRQNFRIPQLKLFVFYLIIIFVSTLLATDGSSAMEQLILFTKRVLVFIMVLFNINTLGRLNAAIGWTLLLSLFLAYQAYLQATVGHSWGGMTPYPGYSEIRVRWYGDWDGPNVYGILFVVATAMSMELIFGKHALMSRLSGLGLSLSYLTAIFFTNSRGAVLAVACAILFYFKDRFKSVIAWSIGGLAVFLLFTLGPSRLQQVSSGESSAHERTWLWEQGLGMLKEHPLLGVGRGEFIHNVDLGLIAHNNYVQNFSETGLLGFFCFVAILWFTFKGNLLVSESEGIVDNRYSAKGRMMNAALVGYAAATFFVVMELDLFYFILGLSSATYVVTVRENPSMSRLEFTRRDLYIILGAMAGIIFMVWLAAVKEIL